MIASVTVSSRTKLAQLLGVSVTMVDRYIIQGMPGENGSYDVEECRQWLAAYRASKRDGRGGVGGGDGANDHDGESQIDLRERRLMAECDKLEQEARAKRLNNEVAEGNLLPSDDVHQFIAQSFLLVRSRLETIPDQVQMVVPGDARSEVHRLLQDYVYGVLTELADLEFKGPWEKKSDDEAA